MAAAASLTAASMIMTMWFPGSQAWEWSLLFMAVMGVLNFFPVKTYGEVEFWFAEIKIAAILFFIVVGMAIVFDVIPSFEYIGRWGNFYEEGLFPNGIVPFLYGLVVVVCTYQGAELVGVTAGESEDPQKNIKKAIKNVGIRILLFFVISVLLVALIMPWTQASVGNSPFIAILQQAHIRYIDVIMQFVIVAACLSAVNSAFYACARLLWSMSKSNHAPKIYAHTNKHGWKRLGTDCPQNSARGCGKCRYRDCLYGLQKPRGCH